MSLELSKPPRSGVSSAPATTATHEGQDSKQLFPRMPAWRAHHCERIAQVEHPHVGSEQAPCMRKLVYRCTVGSLRITAPVPRTWDSSQARHAANSNRRDPCNLRNCARSIARGANRTKVVWWGWAIAVQPASPRSYQLVGILSHGTVSSSSLVEGPEGQRGTGCEPPTCHQPPTPSVRAIDIPES